MSILIFFIVLFALVLVHELGHFIVAKWTGMRVDEFGIGFPPKLFGIKRGETEYTLNLFPIGGFVKIRGEDGVLTGEENHSDGYFTSKSKIAQATVLVAGVTMNILFAWALITIAFTVGVHGAVSEQEATESALLTITNVLPESPAARAQIPLGSAIQSVTAGNDTLQALTPSAFSAFIGVHGDEQVTLAYTDGEGLHVVQVNPATNVIVGKEGKSAIGVALVLTDTISRSFGASIIDATTYVFFALRDITVGITKLAVDAVLLRADFSQVAGPVGMVGLVGQASSFGVTSLLMFTAFISLNLAVINILPLPALDGGRLVFVLIEAVRKKPIRANVAGTLNTIGFIFLLLLMVAVTWNDIARL